VMDRWSKAPDDVWAYASPDRKMLGSLGSKAARLPYCLLSL
jgi:hypothetical protein